LKHNLETNQWQNHLNHKLRPNSRLRSLHQNDEALSLLSGRKWYPCPKQARKTLNKMRKKSGLSSCSYSVTAIKVLDRQVGMPSDVSQLNRLIKHRVSASHQWSPLSLTRGQIKTMHFTSIRFPTKTKRNEKAGILKRNRRSPISSKSSLPDHKVCRWRKSKSIHRCMTSMTSAVRAARLEHHHFMLNPRGKASDSKVRNTPSKCRRSLLWFTARAS